MSLALAYIATLVGLLWLAELAVLPACFLLARRRERRGRPAAIPADLAPPP